MGLPVKLKDHASPNFMVHLRGQHHFISHHLLFVCGTAFYKTELSALIYKFTGRKPVIKVAGNSDLQIPDYDIMGKAEPEAIEFVTQEELSFGPPDDFDEQARKDNPAPEKQQPPDR
jgi:hypothetical protein